VDTLPSESLAEKARWLVAYLLLVAALAACVPPPQPPEPATPSSTPERISQATAISAATATSTQNPPLPTATCEPPTEWQLTLAISGGFAGVAHRLTVGSNGKATAVDERSGETATATLSPQDLAELELLVCTASQAPVTSRPPVCADCFNYSLTLGDSGKPVTWTWNDISLRDHPAAPLVQALRLHLDDLLDGP